MGNGINGNAGDDTLDGGTDNDRLSGGDGADRRGRGKAYELVTFDGGVVVTKDDLFFS